ncbi:hypothetical protein SAMN05421882_105313 [Nitrosomonas communis]|uniref:Transposase n=1 Tax=Nitrosomonas communis TaxID=44574 RepID=A0A1H2YJM9_9PROT|nr:hypothetical protein SAMN05421882_105313 [Nitrosomonas communis]
MRDYQSLAHTTWDCKYYVVFIPKRRKEGSDIRNDTKTPWKGIARISRAEKLPDSRRAPDA